MTLCHTIKKGNISLAYFTIKEICIIIQTQAILKPQYVRAMLRQIHIINTKAANPMFQEGYLTNVLVNPRGKPLTFYEMDLLLEHQKKKFKWFWVDKNLSL